MASYRARFLQIQAASERALAQLFRDLAAGIAADVARRADADGVVPRTATFELQRQSAERIQRMYLGRNRAGELAPFETLANGRVIALAPYPQALWAAITAAVRLPVEENAAILTKRLPDDILDVMRRARVDPFKAVGAKVAETTTVVGGPSSVVEVEIFRPNPLATYEAPHTWVDPNGYRLSDRIWNVAAAERSRLDAYLDDSIKRGTGALTMAKELEQFLDPSRKTLTTNKPYGSKASYDAMRLARSEITQAHYKADMAASAMNPFVEGMGWMLSASHPRRDICDDYARGGPEGDGVYPLGEVPSVPHPQCLCWRKKVLRKDPDAVIASLRDDIRAARADLVDKIGPVEVENFDRLLLGETLPPIVAQPARTRREYPPVALPPSDPLSLAEPGGLQYTAPQGQIDSVTKKLDVQIASLAQKHGVTPAEVEAVIDKAFRQLTQNSEIVIQAKSSRVDQILSSGRFKTQFETNSSGGVLDLQYRSSAEYKGLGIPSDIDKTKRPVYGYLYLNDKSRERVRGYGDFGFVMKDSVRARATVTMNDSIFNFDFNRVAGSPIDNPQRVAWDDGVEALYDYGRGEDSLNTLIQRMTYIEVQIHGGVTLDDVDFVLDKANVLSDAKIAKLTGRGIPVNKVMPKRSATATPRRAVSAPVEVDTPAPVPAPTPIAAPAPTPTRAARTTRTKAPTMTPEEKAAAAEAKRVAKDAEKAAKAEATRIAKAEEKARKDAEKAAEKAAKAEATRIAKAEEKARKDAEKAAEKAAKAAEKLAAAANVVKPDKPARTRKATKPVTVLTGDTDASRGILKAQETERQIYTQRFESAYAYKPDGTLVLSKDGERYAVKFDFEEYDKLTGTIFTHNHPRGWDVEASDPRRVGNSFSLADVKVASVVKLRELRAVTPAHTYRMVEPAGGWPNFATTINPLYEQRDREVTRELQRLVTSGVMSAEQAESEHYHRVWSAVTSELGIPYYKEVHGYS